MPSIRHLVITALYKSVIEADFKTVERKFLDQGIEKGLIKTVLDSFKDLKNKHRIKKTEEKNIDWWGKKDFKELKDFVTGLQETKSKTEETKIKKAEGAELRAENDLWYVYKIISHESACFYGSKTKWCITEKDGKNFSTYSESNNFYFFISKTRDSKDPLAKIAMNINTKGDSEWWDASDKKLTSKDLAKFKKELPNFKIDKVLGKVEIDGKLYALDNLPSNVKGDLDLEDTSITSLPDGLKVGGSLNLKNTAITSLPDGLQVGGSLNLSETKITSLPNDLKVGYSLFLSYTAITSIPDGLIIRGNLSLNDTKITSLPEGLSVGDYLDLSRTPITSIPKDLKVGGNLYLMDTKITSLPGLSVGGNLYLRNTKITSLPKDLKVEGDLDLRDTKITSLSEGLRVGGSLDLRNTKITSLPKGLRVWRDLYLEGTQITSLPKDLSVGGRITGFKEKS